MMRILKHELTMWWIEAVRIVWQSANRTLLRAASAVITLAVMLSCVVSNATLGSDDTAIADPSSSFREVIDAWARWESGWEKRSHHYQIRIEEDRSVDPQRRVRVVRVCKRAGKFAVSSVKAEDDITTVLIQNPSYAARIVKAGAGPWRLTGLAKRTDEKYQEFVNQQFRADFVGQVLRFHTNLWETLRKGDWEVRSAERKVESGRRVRRFDVKLTKAGMEATHLLRLIVVVSEEHALLPVQVSIVHREGTDLVITFTGWAVTPQGLAWQKRREELGPLALQKMGGDVARWGWSESRCDVRHISRRFDKDEAYLSYYGLPEPEGVRTRGYRLWIFLGVGIALLAISAILVAKRRA